MTPTDNERDALLEKLLAEYWDIAYSIGSSGLWNEKAQSSLNDIRKLFKTQSPISQNEQQEAAGYVSGLPIKTPQTIRRDANDVFKYPLYSSPKQISEEWKLIGKISKIGVVWYKQYPHAYPIGTEFYAVLPTTSLTSETNTVEGE